MPKSAMGQRGKAVVETYINFPDFNYSASEMPCRKHPNRSSVGICAYCLKERLVKLVCSECGEQRLSSCSCSDNSSSNRNSSSTMEMGSVGRISFLLENEKIDDNLNSKYRRKQKEEVIFLRRSSSSCVEVKKSNGFWKIKRLFRKKRNKGCGENCELFSDDKSEIWVSDIMGVSRSRSLCSFRGGRQQNGIFDDGSDYALSSAKISDVTNGIFFDSDKQFGLFCDSELGKSGLRGVLDGENGIDPKWGRRIGGPNVFPVKESDFSAMDESGFIDLKLDSWSEPKQDFSAPRMSDHGIGYSSENGQNLASIKGNGGSCRITVNERGLKRGSRGHKVWKWIFKYRSAAKEEK